MKILDRYILRQFIATFLFITSMIIIVATLIDFVEKNDNYLKNNLSYQEIGGYYMVFLPFIVNLIMPITVFITTVFVTARLAQRTEIIALLSSGVSLRRFIAPFLVGGCCIALFNFLLTGWVLAGANKKRVSFEEKYIRTASLRKQTQADTPPPVHVAVSPTEYLGMEHYYIRYQSGRNITLEKMQDGQVVEKTTAKFIRWTPLRQQWELQYWHKRTVDGLQEHVSHGKSLFLSLDLNPEDIRINPRIGETLTLPELSAHIQLLRKKGAENLHIFLIERHIRFMSPIALIILTFIGIAVAARKSRGGMGLQVALGFFLAIIYIALFLTVKGVAEARGTNLMLIVWTPNLLFTCLGLLLYHFTPK